MAIEKTPERATAGPNPSLAQLCNRLHQSQVRLLGNQIEYLLRKLFQWRNASSTRLRHSALAFVPALQPLYRRTHAHLETFSRLAPRRTGLQRLRLRAPADHQNRPSASPAPATENQCTKTRSSLTLWESREFKSGGNRFRIHTSRCLKVKAGRRFRRQFEMLLAGGLKVSIWISTWVAISTYCYSRGRMK